MKFTHFLFLALVSQFNLAIAEDSIHKEIVKTIEDQVVDLNIELNSETAQCLLGDYSASSLKISIPAIKQYTNLDHTSPGAPGPCINAGRCRGRFGASDPRLALLQDKERPTENINLRVLKEEVTHIFSDSKTCVRTYREKLSSTIRGINFHHRVQIDLASVDTATCNELLSKM